MFISWQGNRIKIPIVFYCYPVKLKYAKCIAFLLIFSGLVSFVAPPSLFSQKVMAEEAIQWLFSVWLPSSFQGG